MLDTSGEPLKNALPAEPAFVKPNRDEAESLLGSPISSLDAACAAVRKVITMGARSTALSLGGEGLLYCPGKDALIYLTKGLKLRARSTVGCGDAALAGFAKSFASEAPPEEAIRTATACAAANCLAQSPGAVRLSDIEKFRAEISVQRLR